MWVESAGRKLELSRTGGLKRDLPSKAMVSRDQSSVCLWNRDGEKQTASAPTWAAGVLGGVVLQREEGVAVWCGRWSVEGGRATGGTGGEVTRNSAGPV